ncbi:MAG: hypothetical protein ACREND_18545 [Gemmatimonadaceae bacterium]
MSRSSSSRSAARTVALAACVSACAVGCGDGARGITAVSPPPLGGVPSGAHVIRGEIDDTGAVTFTSLDDGASGAFAPGIDPNVYGRQGVDVRIYAKPATVVTNSGNKTWTMQIGVRNLEPYPVGSIQGGSAPTDTTGVFLAFVGGPTVTKTSGSCSGTCSGKITVYDGTGTFTAGKQMYLYWKQRLTAYNTVGGTDTVLTRHTVKFTSQSQVTNMVFYLMVRADWPPPAQTSWAVSYVAASDSFPDSTASASGGHAEPRWKSAAQSPYRLDNESWSTSGFSTNVSGSKCYYVYRRDSLTSTSDAYMQATVNLNQSQGNPETVLGFLDGTRMVAVGLTGTTISFISYGGSTPAAQVLDSTAAFSTGTHTITLHKYKADSAVIEVDGSRKLKELYGDLPASPSQSFTFTSGPAEFFGAGSTTSGNSDKWIAVAYGIGTTHP